MLVDSLHLKARLDWQAVQMGAHRVTTNLDSAGWKGSEFRLAATSGRNCAYNRAVSHYAAHARRTVNARVGKQFASHESLSLIWTKFFSISRRSHQAIHTEHSHAHFHRRYSTSANTPQGCLMSIDLRISTATIFNDTSKKEVKSFFKFLST